MSSHPSDPTPAVPWLPWRSACFGWIVTAVVLLIGVPLFLCMPSWTDVTLYDMAARTVLRGGVHYRDVFDTNLPGIVWAMAAVRAALGPSLEALRAVDLLVIAAEAWLLIGWLRRAGVPGYVLAWFAASVAMFYPFITEFNHVQRDPWMLLPALAAARLRLARVERAGTGSPRFGASVLEGCAWGIAVWIKPHVVIPAFTLWLASAFLIARREPGRGVRLDLTGLVLGGVLVGAGGVAWLVATGTWPHFLDVFLKWNPAYVSDVLDQAGERFLYFFFCFLPFSWLHGIALPLALLALWEVRIWSRRSGEPRSVGLGPMMYLPAASEAGAANRALLAALYLGWFMQGVVFQKGFDYVQVPAVLLAMAVVASHRWAFGFAALVRYAVLAVLLNTPATAFLGPTLGVWQAPFTDPVVLKNWPRCWQEGSSPELRNKLGMYIDIHCGTNWENLDAVAKYLKTVEPPLGPRELNCWHDSTHPLYLMLNLEPATRYMHYGTVFDFPSKDNWITKQIAEEVRQSPQRYVVSDLNRMTQVAGQQFAPGAGGDPLRLPAWFPLSQRDKYPWNQPIVFRAGRYVVHKVVNPLGEIGIPNWYKLDKLGPGEKP